MIPVKVDQLFVSNMGFVVLLKGLEDKRVLQIFIGAAEAQAIHIHLSGVQIPRPLTHDLFKNLLEYFECRLTRIEVCDLLEGTFYAKLFLEREGMETEVDCRPSDAVALALRCAAPIFVADKVMDEAGRVLEEPPAEAVGSAEKPAGAGSHGKEPKPAAKPRNQMDKLKQDLDKAVQEERYEDAAGIRDEIKRLESVH